MDLTEAQRLWRNFWANPSPKGFDALMAMSDGHWTVLQNQWEPGRDGAPTARCALASLFGANALNGDPLSGLGASARAGEEARSAAARQARWACALWDRLDAAGEPAWESELEWIGERLFSEAFWERPELMEPSSEEGESALSWTSERWRSEATAWWERVFKRAREIDPSGGAAAKALRPYWAKRTGRSRWVRKGWAFSAPEAFRWVDPRAPSGAGRGPNWSGQMWEEALAGGMLGGWLCERMLAASEPGPTRAELARGFIRSQTAWAGWSSSQGERGREGFSRLWGAVEAEREAGGRPGEAAGPWPDALWAWASEAVEREAWFSGNGGAEGEERWGSGAAQWARFLLELGARPDAPGPDGMSAIEHLRGKSGFEAAGALLEAAALGGSGSGQGGGGRSRRL